MRKTGFLLLGSLAVACTLALWYPPAVKAQNAPDTAQTTDPKSLLLAAAAANGAPGPDAKPWHAKISFTLNDWNGKPESQGTFEEFWAGPDKYKRIYATSTFSHEEYTTPAGIRRTGSRDGAPPELTRVIDNFLHPIAVDAASAETTQLKMQPIKSPNAKLACVSAFRPGSANSAALNETYCLEENLPILRMVIVGAGYTNTIRNNFVRFQGHYFPQTIEQVSGNAGEKTPRQLLAAKLETLEAIQPLDDSLFTPPADAFAPPPVITLDEKTTKAQLVQHAPAVYPPIAKAARVSGNVVIALMVLTDGHVSHLRVLSGPAMLQQATLDAVRKYTYKPFEQNGVPVEVDTTVTVKFETF